MTGRYFISEGVEVYASINNIFNKEPPAIRNQLNNTDVHTYDLLGRFFYVGLTLRF